MAGHKGDGGLVGRTVLCLGLFTVLEMPDILGWLAGVHRGGPLNF
jgi:hypothetical protein